MFKDVKLIYDDGTNSNTNGTKRNPPCNMSNIILSIIIL